MADNTKPAPFKVRTLEGVLHSSHHTIEQANHAANTANDAASKMGTNARYEPSDETPAAE